MCFSILLALLGQIMGYSARNNCSRTRFPRYMFELSEVFDSEFHANGVHVLAQSCNTILMEIVWAMASLWPLRFRRP